MIVPLKRKHNTQVFKEGLHTTVRLYGTDILHYDAATSRLVLSTGGWETMTTRRRMVEAMKEVCGGTLFGKSFNVWGHKGHSELYIDGVTFPFVNGRLEIILSHVDLLEDRIEREREKREGRNDL